MYYETIRKLKSGIRKFREAKDIQEKIFYIIIPLTFYIPLEDTITGILPIPDAFASAIRLFPELVLYASLAALIHKKLHSREQLQKTPIDPIVAMFFIASGISILNNNSSIAGSIENLRTNWRFLSLYYIIVNTKLTNHQLSFYLIILKKIGLVQAGIVCLQIFLPASFNSTLTGGGCSKIESKGARCGTFVDSASLSLFLLIAALVSLTLTYISFPNLIPSLRNGCEIITVYLSIYISKKRAALLIAMLFPIFIFSFLKRRRNLLLSIWIGSLIGIIVLFLLTSISFDTVLGANTSSSEVDNDASYFGSIFSLEYWQHNAENSRGWMILTVVKTLWESGKWFGFGPELGSILRGIGEYLSSPEDQAQLLRNLGVFDDPYWFAILGYFGIVGLILYWLILIRLYLTAKQLDRITETSEQKSLVTIVRTLIITAFIYGFIERIFRLRAFSFYFWFLSGLMMNLYVAQRDSQRRNQ